MIQIGNINALLALLGYPLVGWWLFRTLPRERALIWTILAGYMFLPQLSAIDLPLLPPLNKETIPNLVAFVLTAALLGRMPQLLPRGWVGRGLMLAFLVSPAATVFANLEPIPFGVDTFGSLRLVDPNALQVWGLPGLRIYDSISALVQQALLMLPYFLARELLRSEDGIREILIALVIAGAIYALPMLWEVRFSPQLHTKLYGFFQHDFAQAMRDGGFRPFVFMPHALWVAFFAFMCAMAAATWLRIAPRQKVGWRMFVLAGMVGLVVITKSLGALVYTLVFVPVILVFRPRLNLALAAVLVCLVMAYPMLRGSGVIPTRAIIDRIASTNPERAQSLEYRFTNEDRILAHVASKPILGWGGWGRFMLYDPATGRSETVVDGMWILTIGQFGWLGYIAMFGLLVLPVLSLWWQARKPEAPPVPIVVSSLALIVAVNMVDLLPNATLIPFTWLMAGALLGYAETIRETVAAHRAANLQRLHGGVALGTKPAPARPQKPASGPRTVL